MKKQIHAYANTPIRYNPYQYLPLKKMLENKNSNILISDEVGLGKTIEAGIIIDEYLHETQNKKVLIICPAFLRDKWQEELNDKFYLTSYIFKGKKHTGTTNNITILPLSRLKTFIDKDLHLDYSDSLIIVDEAHYFRNDKSARFKYLKEIVRSNKNVKLVFMTATPVNNSELDYAHLYKLLNNHNGLITTNTTKQQAYIDLRKRNIKDLWIDLTDEEYGIYNETDKLDDFSGTIYRHIGAGCLYSLVRYAERNYSFDDDSILAMKSFLSLENDYEDEGDENSIERFYLDVELPKVDTKIIKLKNVLKEHRNEKIVVFAHYIETILYLYDQIKRFYRNEHMNPEKIAYIYGNSVSDNIDIRNKKNKFIDVKKWFDNGETQKILICSDACKEGVDLDSANVLINYDLPFNPSIVEQRVGRIDRMSQKKDMTIYNFHVNNTYDDRLNAILNMKLKYIANLSRYNIGNPLNIRSEDADIIINKYIKYFENREFSNEDLFVLKKVFNDMKVKTPNIKQVEQDRTALKKEFKRLVLENKNGIIKWLSKSNSKLEREILIEHYNELDKCLGFNKVDDEVTVQISDTLKDEIIRIFNEDLEFYKILPVLKNVDTYEETLEEYGERKIISRDDIKNKIVINYKTPSLDNFIPYEIVKGWLENE